MKEGYDLFLHSDAPPGSGLGSSSAMMVVLVGLLKEFHGLQLTDYEVAETAYAIERVDLGIQGGMQDQYAAAFGGFNFIEFLADRVVVNSLKVSPDILNELEYNLLLCHTGKVRLSDNIIEDQVRRYEEQESDTTDALKELKALATEMKNALLRRQMDEFGELLDLEWQHKKRMSPRISSPELDELYDVARREGALGRQDHRRRRRRLHAPVLRFRTKARDRPGPEGLGCQIHEIALEPYGLQTWRVNGSAGH